MEDLVDVTGQLLIVFTGPMHVSRTVGVITISTDGQGFTETLDGEIDLLAVDELVGVDQVCCGSPPGLKMPPAFLRCHARFGFDAVRVAGAVLRPTGPLHRGRRGVFSFQWPAKNIAGPNRYPNCGLPLPWLSC